MIQLIAFALIALLLGGCMMLLPFGAIVTAPWMWENLPTCDMTKSINERCREVRGQHGGTVDGRIHDVEKIQ